MNKFLEKVGVSIVARVGITLGIAVAVALLAGGVHFFVKSLGPRDTEKAPLAKVKVISEDMGFYVKSQKIEGRVYRLETLTEDAPAVIYCQSEEHGAVWCRELAALGYVAYCYDLSDGEKARQKELQAIVDGIRELRFVNRRKVYLLGEAHGCLTASTFAFENTGKIAGLMLLSPGFNPLEISRKARRYSKPVLVLDASLPQSSLLQEISSYIGSD